MIDTIVLTLENGYKITDYEAFSPSARDLFEHPYRKWGREGVQRSIQNPNKADTEYKPRLTISKRRMLGSFPILRIELSLPKLYFGNNFAELQDSLFPLLVDYLELRLKSMGVIVERDALINAKVAVVHYSKNILLEQGLTCSLVTAELAKSRISEKMDINTTKFRNGGHALTFHSNSYEVTFYDKVKDIQQAKISPKRGIAKGYTQEDELFADKYAYTQQVLRFEVRLNRAQKIKDILAKAGIETELAFKNIFSERISKAVLQYFWDMLLGNIPPVTLHSKEVAPTAVFLSSKHANIHKRLEEVAYRLLLQELGTEKAVKNLLNTKAAKRTTNRIIRSYGKHDKESITPYMFKGITQALAEFKPLTIEGLNTI